MCDLGKALHLPAIQLGGGNWVETTDPPSSVISKSPWL